MPEEQPNAATAQLPPETQPPPAAEPGDAPEGAEQPPEDESRKLWQEHLPELADSYDELSPEAREKLLLNRLAATTASGPSTGEESGKPESPAGEPEARTPSTVQIPELGLDDFESSLAEELQDRAAAQLIRRKIQILADFVQGMGGLVVRTLDDQKGTLAGFEKQLSGVTRPNSVREAIKAVPGATEADAASAVQLLESGEATSPEAAVKLAVFNRRAEVEKATPRGKASDEARRKAAALAAARRGGSSRRPGERAQRIPQGQDQLRQMFKDVQDGVLKE